MMIKMSKSGKVESPSNPIIFPSASAKEYHSQKSKMYSTFITIWMLSGDSTSMILGWHLTPTDPKEMVSL